MVRFFGFGGGEVNCDVLSFLDMILVLGVGGDILWIGLVGVGFCGERDDVLMRLFLVFLFFLILFVFWFCFGMKVVVFGEKIDLVGVKVGVVVESDFLWVDVNLFLLKVLDWLKLVVLNLLLSLKGI